MASLAPGRALGKSRHASQKKTFEYRNPLVQDRADFLSESGGLSYFLRRLTTKKDARELTPNAAALGLSDFKNENSSLKLALLFKFQQTQEYCQIRDIITKKFLNKTLKSQNTEALSRDQKRKINKLVSQTEVQVLPDLCDHDINKEKEFQVHINHQFGKYRRQLAAMKSSKVDKKQMYERLREEDERALRKSMEKDDGASRVDGPGDVTVDEAKRSSVIASGETNVDFDDDESMDEE